MSIVSIPAWYYQQFDADFNLDVPGEGYGGWKKGDIEIDLDHTAIVLMHAWDNGTREQYPGWHRCVEYIPRAQEICRNVLPDFLRIVRASNLPLFHIVADGHNYYANYPGYKKTVELAGAYPEPLEMIERDPTIEKLIQFRNDYSFVGKHNQEDVRKGFENLDFAPEAFPVGDEPIAKDSHQLFALCKNAGINHLIYTGFAINYCLFFSPGGMVDMSRRGIMCSAIRQAVTAVENKETARKEIAKEVGLWQVSILFGFVFDIDDVKGVLSAQQYAE